MHTQNVNTAAQEPSERWGKDQAANCIEKCLLLSTAHMTEDDSGLFYWLPAINIRKLPAITVSATRNTVLTYVRKNNQNNK